MSSSPTMRTVLLTLVVALLATAAAAAADGTSNTILIGEKQMRCHRVEPDPQTLRTGGPGSLRIWITTGFFEVASETSGRRLGKVRLISDGPAGRREVRLSDVTFEPASTGASTRSGASSPAPQQGFGAWEVNYERILVLGAAQPAPDGRR